MDHIAQNRIRCGNILGVDPQNLITAYQVHGVAVVEVTTPWEAGQGPRADAMVTAKPGIALGILTADCAPILFADSEAGIIGAAHSGWKGAKAGVAGATVAAMVRLGAERGRIAACIGPTIGPQSYEVGEEFRQAFLADDPSAARFFIDADKSAGRPHFDLQSFVAAQMETLGICEVDRIEADTCADTERFFSYRRSCLMGENDYGRQLSAIALI